MLPIVNNPIILQRPGLARLFERCGFEPAWLIPVPKINRGRIEGAVEVQGLTQAIWGGLYVALWPFELSGRGIAATRFSRR
ncbi:MAG: hypothetical protein MUP28_10580 [Candidatus Aminicenantes bacterium]|nr:hypothetical protein [Candidatus Aminicenantes bacterium]